jgi:hypothetical protein
MYMKSQALSPHHLHLDKHNFYVFISFAVQTVNAVYTVTMYPIRFLMTST